MFFIFSFLFFLLRNQRTGGWNRYCLERRAGTSGRGEVLGKGDRRVNMLQKMCTHVSKCKNDTCRKLLQNWGGEDEGEWLRK
jgi:hypothetical protein